MPLIELWGTTEGLIVSHAMLFQAALLCVLYMFIFEMYLFKRLQTNLLEKIAIFSPLAQLGNCTFGNLTYNYEEYNTPVYNITELIFVSISLCVSNMLGVYFFFNQ